MQRPFSIVFAVALTVAAAVLALPGHSRAESSLRPTECETVAGPATSERDSGVRIELVRGGNVAVGVVDDSPPGRALLARLPLTVQLRDSFGLALIGGVSPSLAIETGPTSCRFQSGEIVYSTGDRSIAILHSPEVSQLRTPGLLRLGVITDGLRGLAGDGAISIRRSW